MRSLLVILLILFSSYTFGQDLMAHQWEHRILVVQDYTEDGIDLSQQLEEISKDIPGLIERKFLVYKVTRKGFQEGLDSQSDWNPWKEEGFPVCRQGDISFCVQIVGLDGGVKWTSNNVTSMKVIFEIVDAMPMRSAELRRLKKKPKE